MTRDIKLIKLGAKCELARRNFFYYCNLKAPDFYKENTDDEKLRKLGVNLDAIDSNPLAQDCLKKIVINNPKDIAEELLEHGMSDSWLYPEMPIVANEIENHRVYY